MAEAAARHGYRAASVARVIERAGVSRATFYEHFADREACFLAAYGEIALRIEGEIERAGRLPAAARPRQALTAILVGAEQHPAATRMMTIEAFGAGPLLRARREQLLGVIEAGTGRYLEELPSDAPRPQIPVRALIGGVESMIGMRVFQGRAAHSGRLLFDLLDWIDSYAVAADQPLLSAAEWTDLGRGPAPVEQPNLFDQPSPRRLPRGRAALAPAAVAAEHRARITAAVARLSREQGYGGTTVTDIAAAAGVTRQAFYRQFRGKEEAILAAQNAGLRRSIAITAAAFFDAGPWPERVWSGLQAMLGYVASEPDLAWLDIVESYVVGPAAVSRSFDNRMAFTLFLEEGYRQSPQARRLPELSSEAIGGAIVELLRTLILAGRGERALELLPQTAYIALAPFIGPGPALELVREKVEYTESLSHSNLTI